MFDVGFGELLILALIGLLVLGPERLPKVARQVGQYTRKARQAWHQMRHELEKEIDTTEIKQTVQHARETLNSVKKQVHAGVEPIQKPFAESSKKLQQTLDDISNIPNEAATNSSVDNKADE